MTKERPKNMLGTMCIVAAVASVLLTVSGCGVSDWSDALLLEARGDQRATQEHIGSIIPRAGLGMNSGKIDPRNERKVSHSDLPDVQSSAGELNTRRARFDQPIVYGESPRDRDAENSTPDRQPVRDHSRANVMVAALLEFFGSATDVRVDEARPETDAIMTLLGKKEFGKALELATRLTQISPSDPLAYNLQGAAYVGKNELSNARKSFEHALSVHPDYFPAMMNLAQLDLHQQDLASARKRYQAILVKDEKDVSAMIGMAMLEAANNNDKEGFAWLDKAKLANPQALAPRLYLGIHSLRTKDYAKALAELTEAQRYHPNNPDVLELLAHAQVASKQKANAVTTYRALTTLRPESPLAYYRLAIAQVNNEELPAAAESLRKAVQLEPTYYEAVDALAMLEVRAGRPAKAFTLAQDLQKLAPKSPKGQVLEAEILMQQQRYTDAAKAYQKAFAIGQTGELAVKLHAAKTKAGNAKEADAKLQLWLKDHPDDVVAWQYSAGEKLKAGQNKLAMVQYRQVLQIDPTNLIALNNLANLYQWDKDPRALEVAERAYKVMPGSPAIADTLGWLLVEQGKAVPGLELVQKAAIQDPNNSEIRYHLAVALAKSGDKAKARKELEELLARDPKFTQREAAQAMLKQL